MKSAYIIELGSVLFLCACHAAPSAESQTLCTDKAAFFELSKQVNQIYCDNDYLYVESNGLPDHTTMVGIVGWNQQVPIEQDFSQCNAWRIPLYPIYTELATMAPCEGPIAVAINGVPIFSPNKQPPPTDENTTAEEACELALESVDTVDAQELDTCAGHAGRADDYHYHTKSECLLELSGTELPFALALDGFALYGYFEPDGTLPDSLDECQGHSTLALGYHYHAQENVHALVPCFHGRVEEIFQPTTHPIRASCQPFTTSITSHNLESDGWKELTFEYEAKTVVMGWFKESELCYRFRFVYDIQQPDDFFEDTYCQSDNPIQGEELCLAGDADASIKMTPSELLNYQLSREIFP